MGDFTDLYTFQVPLVESFVRGSVIYLGLFFFLRFCLKRQSSDLGVSDLLVIVLIADAFQNGMSPEKQTVPDSFVLAGVILAWAYALDFLAHRYAFVQRLVRPREVMLVKDGKAIRRNMRSELVTMEELMSQIRLSGVEKLTDVKSAFMEADGKFSVISFDGEAENDKQTVLGV